MNGSCQDARAIFQAALAAADPERSVQGALGGRSFAGPVTVVGAGKAVVPMAAAVEKILPQAVGLVVTRYGYGGALRRIRVEEAGHPVPDERGLRATEEILQRAGTGDLLVLLSGGASALLSAPAGGVTLEEKRLTTEALLRAGAPIEDLNCVRKHLSRIKGGGLVAACPGRILTLILSDVIGDRLDVIASGPTAPDPTTFADARNVLRRFDPDRRIPAAVWQHLEAEVSETLKPGDARFERVENVVVGNNRIALDAAEAEAKRRGYEVRRVTEALQGEAREQGKRLARMIRDERGRVCLLAGGETTVTVRGGGQGGRCQELALAGAMELAGVPGVSLLAAGTDGTDGTTNAAGAVVDGSTADSEATRFLENNDSHPYLQQRSALVMTGPTRTNVMDVVVLLRSESAPGIAATGRES